jgi:hypothetical protein
MNNLIKDLVNTISNATGHEDLFKVNFSCVAFRFTGLTITAGPCGGNFTTSSARTRPFPLSYLLLTRHNFDRFAVTFTHILILHAIERPSPTKDKATYHKRREALLWRLLVRHDTESREDKKLTV